VAVFVFVAAGLVVSSDTPYARETIYGFLLYYFLVFSKKKQE